MNKKSTARNYIRDLDRDLVFLDLLPPEELEPGFLLAYVTSDSGD